MPLGQKVEAVRVAKAMKPKMATAGHGFAVRIQFLPLEGSRGVGGFQNRNMINKQYTAVWSVSRLLLYSIVQCHFISAFCTRCFWMIASQSFSCIVFAERLSRGMTIQKAPWSSQAGYALVTLVWASVQRKSRHAWPALLATPGSIRWTVRSLTANLRDQWIQRDLEALCQIGPHCFLYLFMFGGSTLHMRNCTTLYFYLYGDEI